jgi:hypothetical protein
MERLLIDRSNVSSLRFNVARGHASRARHDHACGAVSDLHVKNQFRILKWLLIENAALGGHVLDEPGPSVRLSDAEAKGLWLTASKGEVQ